MQTEHALIGVSPFNSLFTTEWLCAALIFGKNNYGKVDILHPGETASALLRAIGGSQDKALQKTRKQIRQDFRRISEAVTRTGISLQAGTPLRIDEALLSEWYSLQRETVITEFHTNAIFQETCLKMSAQAAASRQKAVGSSVDPDLNIAVSYIFDELPAYTHSSQLVNAPVTLLYPRPWPVGELIDSGSTSITTDPSSHFQVFDPLKELSDV